jgi:hypothetical protein
MTAGIDRRDLRRDSLVLFVASVFILASGAFWGLPEGKSVVGGMVILDGGVPYRDLWTMYAPGQFYVVAALFWLFGRELLVQAMAVVLVRAASAVVFFVLLQRLGATRLLAISLSAIFVLMFWTTGVELFDYPPALLFLLLALDRVVRYFGGGGRRHLSWAGLWLGFAACFKHDIAAYMALGTTVGLFLSWLVAGVRRPGDWLSPARATLTIATSAVIAALPLALWTAWSAGAEAWNDIFVFPATVFRQVRTEAFPPLVPDVGPLFAWLSNVTHVGLALAAADALSPWAMLNAPTVIFLGGVGIALAGNPRLDVVRSAQLTLFLVCLPFFWAAAHVQQNTHPYTMSVLGACVGVLVWSWLSSLAVWKRLLRWPLLIAVAIYATGLLTLAGIRAATVYYEWTGSRVLDFPGFGGVRVPARVYDSFHPVGQFFRTHTREGEPIYAGLVRHDSIIGNAPLLYAIAGRPACCSYTELHPGVADRLPVQREIIRRLEDGGVRAIVLWQFGWPADDLEIRKQRIVSVVPDAGSTLLDRYIAENFRRIETHGEFHLLWRRDAPFP